MVTVSAVGALHPHATIAARTAGTAGVEVVAEGHQTRSIWIRSISGRGFLALVLALVLALALGHPAGGHRLRLSLLSGMRK